VVETDSAPVPVPVAVSPMPRSVPQFTCPFEKQVTTHNPIGGTLARILLVSKRPNSMSRDNAGRNTHAATGQRVWSTAGSCLLQDGVPSLTLNVASLPAVRPAMPTLVDTQPYLSFLETLLADHHRGEQQ
jgi:hypothetical protein